MKKLFVLLCAFLTINGLVKAQNGICNIEYQGRLLFINSIPTAPYTVVGKAKYKNNKKNEAACTGDPTGICKVSIGIDKALEMVKKGKQVDFDAVIVYSPIKMELIKFNSADKAVNDKCNYASKDYMGKKCGAKEIFFLGTPSKPYNEVKALEVTNFTNLGQRKMGKNLIDNFINKLYERSCKEAKEGLDFDAIMFDDNNIINVRGYLTPRNIKLIKYK